MPATRLSSCPSRDELSAYLLGRIADESSESIAVHLDACPDCRTQLAALDESQDSFVAWLRSPPVADPYVEESQCQRAVARARATLADRPVAAFQPRLHGEYQLVEELGRGGMGTVYKAVQAKLDRMVAVKVLNTGRDRDARAISRFEREMKAIGKLDHRHIVRAHDAREIEGTPTLVMEYVAGLNLGEIVDRAGPLAVPDACEAARQAAVGLQYVHEHGLVHRDIKPSNLMLTAPLSPSGIGAGGEGAHVKILDLGLARFHLDQSQAEETAGTREKGDSPHLPERPGGCCAQMGTVPFFPGRVAGGEMTGTDQAMGTADYMAPEQVNNSRAVDIRADIYSLGCTLYKLLAGRAPFDDAQHKGPAEKMAAHAGQPVPSIRRLNADVSAELAAVLERMLAKEPAARFATPAEAAEALGRFSKGADLAGLVARATAQGPSGSDALAAAPRPAPAAAAESAAAAAAGRRRRRWLAGTAGLLLFSGLAWALCGVLIRIHHGDQVTEVTVSDESKVDIKDRGQVDVELPPTLQNGAAQTTMTYAPVPPSPWPFWVPRGAAAENRAAVSPAQLAEPPQLRFLAERDYEATHGFGQPWRPNGQWATPAEKEMLQEHLSSFRFDLRRMSGGIYARPLRFWFSHPGIDRDSEPTMVVSDTRGTAIPAFPCSTPPYGGVGWFSADNPGWLYAGWLGIDYAPARGHPLPAAVNIRLECAIGPWEDANVVIPVKANARYVKALASGRIDQVGQSLEGCAFVSLVRDATAEPRKQLNFEAVTKAGRKLQPRGWRFGQETMRTERFDFNAPLADIEEFRLLTRTFRTAEFKNVSTQAKPAAPVVRKLEFDLPIEQVLQEDEIGTSSLPPDAIRRVYLTLETGEYVITSQERYKDLGFLRTEGIDLKLDLSPGHEQFKGIDLAAAAVAEADWQSLAAADVARRLSELPPLLNMDASKLPATYLFKTRNGRLGMLQIVGLTEKPRGVKVRHKLVEDDRPSGEFAPAGSSATAVKPKSVTLAAPPALTPGTNLYYFNLDSGESVEFPAGQTPTTDQLRARGVNLYLAVEDHGIQQLYSLNVAASEVLGPRRDAQMVAETLRSAKITAGPTRFPMIGSALIAFRTSNGNAGAVQLNFTGHPLAGVFTYQLLPELRIDTAEYPWGEAREGMKCRLRPRASAGKEGQTPEFWLDLSNAGPKDLEFVQAAQMHCSVAVDGRWYGWSKPTAGSMPGWQLKPGEELDEAIAVQLGDDWTGSKNGVPEFGPGADRYSGEKLALGPGRHSLQVAFRPNTPSGLTLLSNVVEFDSSPAAETLLAARRVQQSNVVEFDSGPAAAQPAAPADKASAAAFGPLIERVVNDPDDTPTDCCIDLASGKLLSMPAHTAGSGPVAERPSAAWFKSNHVDAVGQVTIVNGKPAQCGLKGLDLFAIHCGNEAWQQKTAAQVSEELTQAPWSFQFLFADMTTEGKFPETYLFHTREGGIGILQIVAVVEKPKGVKIHYKLVESRRPSAELVPASSAATAAKPQSAATAAPKTLTLGPNQYLNLDSCRFVEFPAGQKPTPEQLRARGVNLYLAREENGVKQLYALNVAFREGIGDDARDPELAAVALHGMKITAEPERLPTNEPSVDIVFRTANGNAGALHLASRRNDAPEVSVRYELLPELRIDTAKYPWGEVREGMKCRLRPRASAGKAGQTPEFWLDLSNAGPKVLPVMPTPARCAAEVDGQWLGWSKPMGTTGYGGQLKPGEEWDEAISIPLGKSWARSIDNRPEFLPDWDRLSAGTAAWGPGRHKLRLAFRPDGPNMTLPAPTLMSNMVEFDISPAAARPPVPAGAAAALGFAPEAAHTVSTEDADAQGMVFFSMTSGRCLKPPFPLTFRPSVRPAFVELTPELKQWIGKNDVDLLLYFGEKTCERMNLQMQEDFVGQNREWGSIAAEKIAALFARRDADHLRSGYVGASKGEGYLDGPSCVNAFRTRDKAMGIYVTEPFANTARRGVIIRCKLLQKAVGASDSSALPKLK